MGAHIPTQVSVPVFFSVAVLCPPAWALLVPTAGLWEAPYMASGQHLFMVCTLHPMVSALGKVGLDGIWVLSRGLAHQLPTECVPFCTPVPVPTVCLCLCVRHRGQYT